MWTLLVTWNSLSLTWYQHQLGMKQRQEVKVKHIMIMSVVETEFMNLSSCQHMYLGSFSTLLVSFHLQRHMGDFVIQVGYSFQFCSPKWKMNDKKSNFLFEGVWTLYPSCCYILGVFLVKQRSYIRQNISWYVLKTKIHFLVLFIILWFYEESILTFYFSISALPHAKFWFL